MMALAPFSNFVGPSYRAQAALADCELTMNWYPETLMSLGARPKNPSMALMPTPGIRPTVFATGTSSPCRAEFQQDGRAFAILGYKFYEVSSSGALTEIGTVEMDNNPAYITSSGDGGNQLLIVSAGHVYYWNLAGGAVTEIAMPNSAQGHFCGFLSGRFLVLDANTSTLWISNVFSATFDASNFRQRTLAPDRWKSMVVTRSEIWLLGSQSYEVWNVTGAFPIPFAPISGALYPTGIYAPHSAREINNSVAWVSGDQDGVGEVVISDQYIPRPISDFAVAYKINKAVQDGFDLSDAQSMVYQENGHNFFHLTFIEADFSITYDQNMGLWHDRAYWDVRNAVFRAWRPLYHMFAFGKHIVGTRQSESLYVMGSEYFFDVGEAMIRRIRRTPHIVANMNNVFYNELRIGMAVGQGTPNGQGSDPMAILRYSDDGGFTYSNGIYASVGAIGKRKTDVWFSALGMGRDRVFEFEMSDPVFCPIVDAYIDAEQGNW